MRQEGESAPQEGESARRPTPTPPRATREQLEVGGNPRTSGVAAVVEDFLSVAVVVEEFLSVAVVEVGASSVAVAWPAWASRHVGESRPD